jgi:hypothetical protein
MYAPWVHRRTIPHLNRTIYRRRLDGWKVSWHHRMNRRCLLRRLPGRFVLADDQGFSVDRSQNNLLASIFREQLIRSRAGFDQPTMCVMFALPLCPLFFFV